MEKKNCKQCQKDFEVTDADLVFLNKISPTFKDQKFQIPTPTLCPNCRWQRRLVWRNEYILYRRKSDLSGKEMVSVFPEDSPFPVYFSSEWYSDKWDPKTYAKDVDLSRSFFSQFSELNKSVPRYNIFTTPEFDINSEFVNCAGYSKNCYMIFEADRNEDCYYCRGVTDNKDCVDCFRANQCQLCYEGIDINKCYGSFFVQDLDNCSECYFSSNLIGCKNCFGCDGLVQKEFYLFNENVGREKWEEFMRGVKFGRTNVEEYGKKLEEIRRKIPKRYAKIIKCENSKGDHLINCKNADFCFDSIKLEDCKYVFEVQNDAKDAMDYSSFGLATSLVYDTNSSGYSANNILFCNDCYEQIANLIYCNSCTHSVKNCFGCVGLRQSEYCILNKQYTKQEYEDLVAKIIAKMKEDKEWGEFFPMSMSVYAYNESIANDYFPLDRSGAEALDAKWREDTRLIKYDGPFYEPKEIIDDYINSESERQSLLSGVLKCQVTGKPYKIIPQELAFYMKHKLPIPTVSFEARHKGRIAKRNPLGLWSRQCDCEEMSHGHPGRCENKFESTYSPERPYKVYCEKCYQQTI